MKLATCIYQFFDQYLVRIKGSSHQTVKAYRDAFGLFLPFAADRLGIKIQSLQIEHLSAQLIFAFLDHLESDRNNMPITRNHRLAAIKSLAKMIRLMYPQNRKLAETILAIPQKRTQKQLIGFQPRQHPVEPWFLKRILTSFAKNDLVVPVQKIQRQIRRIRGWVAEAVISNRIL